MRAPYQGKFLVSLLSAPLRVVLSVAALLRSARCAIRGVAVLLSSQQNAWIHLFASLLVVVAGWWCEVERVEWCLLILAIALVWSAEALNTALEFLCDLVSPEFHPLIKKSKDTAAAAVLISALAAVVVGVLIFAPRLRVAFPWSLDSFHPSG